MTLKYSTVDSCFFADDVVHSNLERTIFYEILNLADHRRDNPTAASFTQKFP